MRARLPLMMILFLLALDSAGWSQIPTSVIVTTSSANIRSGPGINYSAITAVDRGTILVVLDQVGSWYLVNLSSEFGVSSRTGYINRSTVGANPEPVIDDGPIEPEPSKDPLGRPTDPYPGTPSEELTTYEWQRDWTDTQWREYERFEKSDLGAAGLEWLIPTLGHGYVDRASRGLPPALVSLGGLTLAIVGTQVGCSDEIFGECIDSGSSALFWTGILGYVGGRIWGIVSALDYAEEYNREVARRIEGR